MLACRQAQGGSVQKKLNMAHNSSAQATLSAQNVSSRSKVKGRQPAGETVPARKASQDTVGAT